MTDSARNQILQRIRRQPLTDSPLPGDLPSGILYPNREQQFTEVLQSVGGTAIWLPPTADVANEIRRLDSVRDARQIVCTATGLESQLANRDLSTIDDPHQLEDVDVAIVGGEFAVAENAAVWVSGSSLRHRVVCFLTQHLVLVVPRSQIVDNLHAAYARLDLTPRGYGVFISGPSKTADIEQSLVIGAHGSRTLNVVFTGPARLTEPNQADVVTEYRPTR